MVTRPYKNKGELNMFDMEKKNVFQKADYIRRLVDKAVGKECSDKGHIIHNKRSKRLKWEYIK